MLGEHPSIEIPQSTQYAKEMRKWEALHSRFGPPGRPFVFREYPKVLYQRQYVKGEGIKTMGSYTVNNEEEERNLNSRGFFVMQEAQNRAEREMTEHGRLAAEREFAIQHNRHSPAAVAEIRAAEAEHGAQHLPDVPETPVPTLKKRGRKPKTTAA